MARWSNGAVKRWSDGAMKRWSDGAMERWGYIFVYCNNYVYLAGTNIASIIQTPGDGATVCQPHKSDSDQF